MALPPGSQNGIQGEPDATNCLTAHEFLLHQYDALRGEILKRMEIGYQVVALTITILGVILGLKVATGNTAVNLNSLALIMYPVIALGLSLLWSHNECRAGELGKFVQTSLEKPYIDSNQNLKGWESYLREELWVGDSRPYDSSRISITLIFLGAEAIATVVAIAFDHSLLTYPHMQFLAFPAVSFLLTIGVIWGPIIWVPKSKPISTKPTSEKPTSAMPSSLKNN